MLPRCLLALPILIVASTGSPADLEVEVRGVRPRVGEIRAALFDNAHDFSLAIEVRAMVTGTGEISAGVFTREEDFPQPPLQTLTASPTGRTLRLRFSNLEPGEYAVGLYQDLDADNKLDASVGGNTLEPWGISNNPRPEDRAPTWDEAKFTLPADGATIVIDLK